MFDTGPATGVLRVLRPFELHGVRYFDVAVTLDDGRTETARLGPEGVPPGVEPGDRVRLERAGTIVIGIVRADT